MQIHTSRERLAAVTLGVRANVENTYEESDVHIVFTLAQDKVFQSA